MANGRINSSFNWSISGRQAKNEPPDTFQITVTSGRGPSPGKLNITTTGSDIDLSNLTWASVCELKNDSADTNVVMVYGIKDQSTGVFYPIGEIRSQEKYVLRLYRYLGEEHLGTGTSAASASKLHVKSMFGNGVIVVNAYEE